MENDFEKHLNQIEFFLTKIKEHGMTIKLRKSEFFKKETNFLGYVISSEGIRPNSDRIKSIMDIPAPKNLKQLRRFIGIMNYQSRFLINYATHIAPLRELLKKDVKFRWTSVEQQAFERTKESFAHSVLLEGVREDLPFILYTDASMRGYGAILCQKDENDDNHVIATASRGLTRLESNASVTELEIAAVYFALLKFRQYVYDRKIILYTDHISLSFMNKCKLTSSRISRYVHTIMSHDLEIRHIPGSSNIFSDCLSRLTSNQGLPETVNSPNYEVAILKLRCSEHKKLVERFKKIRDLQRADEELNKLLACAKDISETGTECRIAVKDGILYKLHGKDVVKWKIYIPKCLENDLITSFHEAMNHSGCEKVTLTISDNFYVKHLARKVRQITSTCHLCQLAKPMNVHYDIEPQAIIRDRKNALVAFDQHGPMITSNFGYKYILVMYDLFTKFVKIYPMKVVTSKACLNKIIGDYIPKYGKMEAVLCDNASVHTSRVFKETLGEQNIKLYHSSAYYPQGNPAERAIREVSLYMRILCHKRHSDWYTKCSMIEKVINHSINPTTNVAPIKLMLGLDPDPMINNLPKAIGSDPEISDEQLCKIALQRIKSKTEKRKSKVKRHKHKWQPIIGDYVLVKDTKLSSMLKGRYSRMELIYKGPGRINKVLGCHTYEVIDMKSGKIMGRYHKQLLRPYKQPIQ